MRNYHVFQGVLMGIASLIGFMMFYNFIYNFMVLELFELKIIMDFFSFLSSIVTIMALVFAINKYLENRHFNAKMELYKLYKEEINPFMDGINNFVGNLIRISVIYDNEVESYLEKKEIKDGIDKDLKLAKRLFVEINDLHLKIEEVMNDIYFLDKIVYSDCKKLTLDFVNGLGVITSFANYYYKGFDELNSINILMGSNNITKDDIYRKFKRAEKEKSWMFSLVINKNTLIYLTMGKIIENGSSNIEGIINLRDKSFEIKDYILFGDRSNKHEKHSLSENQAK